LACTEQEKRKEKKKRRWAVFGRDVGVFGWRLSGGGGGVTGLSGGDGGSDWARL